MKISITTRNSDFMKTALKYFQNIFIFPKVKQQLFVTFVFVTIIPITLISALSISNTKRQLTEQHQSLINAEVTRINSTLFDITTSMYTLCEPIITQRSYKEIFSADSFNPFYEQSYASLENILSTMHDTTAAISSIKIYTNNPIVPSGTYIISTDMDYSDMEWHDNLSFAPNKIENWSCTTTSLNNLNQTSYELTLTRRFALSSIEYSAYLVITISYNYLKNRILYTDHLVLAAINNLPVFLSSDDAQLKTDFPFPEDFHGGYYQYSGAIIMDSTEELSSISTFAPYKTNDKFYIMAANPTAYKEINKLTFNYFMISVIACLFPAILILLFATYFSSRVNTLRQTMCQVSLGDYNIINSFHGNDELGQTFIDLQTTVNTIREKEAQIYEAKIARQQIINRQQQMEFKMLASQINPHFLYNTLETIRMQALTNDDTAVAASVKLLGKSMHYVLENTGTEATTLDKELDYVKVYLSIQQIRFPDRINYVIDIDPDIALSHYKILPLLLQPIVENAVIHGLEGISKNGLITIAIHTDGDNSIRITISDNGCGMNEESLHSLIEKINSNEFEGTSSIGLYNINQRIKLLYGEQYSLQISSKIQYGTTVTLTLPQNYIN